MAQLGSHRTDFHEIWHVRIFWKYALKIQVLLKCDNNNGTLHEDQYTFFITSRSNLLRIKTFQTKVVDELKVQTTCWMPFPENRAVFEIMRKNMVEPNTTDENTWHAHCMLDTLGYKHTLTLCNTYCSRDCNNVCLIDIKLFRKKIFARTAVF